MTSLLILVIVVVLTAWLISLMAQFRREVNTARRRGLTARERERRLNQTIEGLMVDEKVLTQRIEDQIRANAEIDKTVEATRTEAAARVAAGRNRLLVLHGRRSPGDKEWIVSVVNPTLLKQDPPHPLAQEWAAGRDYLVFARTDHEARDRALRRFSVKPGTTVRVVVPAPHDLFHG